MTFSELDEIDDDESGNISELNGILLTKALAYVGNFGDIF